MEITIFLPEVIDDESMQELLVLRTELNSEYLKKIYNLRAKLSGDEAA